MAKRPRLSRESSSQSPVTGGVPSFRTPSSAGEPRARDLDIADRLGFSQPRDIRRLIDRNAEELRRYGPLFRRGTDGPRQHAQPWRETDLRQLRLRLSGGRRSVEPSRCCDRSRASLAVALLVVRRASK